MAFFSGLFQKAKEFFTESEEEKKRRQKFNESVGRLFGRIATSAQERLDIPEQVRSAGQILSENLQFAKREPLQFAKGVQLGVTPRLTLKTKNPAYSIMEKLETAQT